MRLWLDAHLPPALAAWIPQQFGVEAAAVRDLGLRDTLDRDIFLAARRADAVVLTKDADFLGLINRLGPPPPACQAARSGLESAQPVGVARPCPSEGPDAAPPR